MRLRRPPELANAPSPRTTELAKERTRSSTTDKVKGSPKRVADKVDQGVGKAADDAAPKREGKIKDATPSEMLSEFKSKLTDEKRSPR
jgi:uncharacterized protein YjbJ (UPF0337 family)